MNYDYVNRPVGFFDELITFFQYAGCDAAFAGKEDFGHYWFKDKDGQFIQTDGRFSSREDRDPVYRALYGLGCISSAHNVRNKKLVGGKIGIIPLDESSSPSRSK